MKIGVDDHDVSLRAMYSLKKKRRCNFVFHGLLNDANFMAVPVNCWLCTDGNRPFSCFASGDLSLRTSFSFFRFFSAPVCIAAVVVFTQPTIQKLSMKASWQVQIHIKVILK